MQNVLEKQEMKIIWRLKWSYQLTSAGQSAHGWQFGCHCWIAGNSCFLRQRIFISSFSEPLGINIEGLNSLFLGIQPFIKIYFHGLWLSIMWLIMIANFSKQQKVYYQYLKFTIYRFTIARFECTKEKKVKINYYVIFQCAVYP